MLEAAPQRTRAVVVGIDHYRYGDAWRLAGPAADALRCVDWLIGRGVPPAGITLCLSPCSWTDDAEVVQWRARHPDVQALHATRAELLRLVDEELPVADADALFMFWGGHGVVDDFASRNYLFTADAADDLPYCIDVQNLADALQGQRFEHLLEQVLIIDACANPYADTGQLAKPAPAAFTRSPLRHDIRQCRMFSASAGQLAKNVSERKSGLFTQALFAQLTRGSDASTAGNQWPDFEAAFLGTLEGVEQLALGRQQPFIVMNWPGRRLVRSGQPPGDSRALSNLLTLVGKTSAAPALLYRLYMRSAPDVHRVLERSKAIESWLRDLADSRPREANLPNSLVEFGERLSRELPAADAASSTALSAWVDDCTHDNVNARNALRDRLDAERREHRARATVCIELEDGPLPNLRWWVQAPDPAHCSARLEVPLDTPLMDSIATHMADILADAERQAGHLYDLMVGLIVPETLLMGELESIKVPFLQDGLPGPARALNRRYPVTLHWRQRFRGGASGVVNAWLKAVAQLKPRFAAGGGADVVWLESASDDDEVDPFTKAYGSLLSAQGSSVCVGVGHAAGLPGAMPPEQVIGCLRAGVPCFFWLSRPPLDEADARQLLCNLFSQQKASDAPLSIGTLRKTAKGSDPLSSVRIVWDEPGYLPPNPRLAPPALPENP